MDILISVKKHGFAIAISLVVNALLTACQAVGEGDSASLNCSLEVPPASSGEMSAEGVQMRIYPRSTEMPRRYSGCQTVWEVGGSKNVAIVMGQRRYLHGLVTEMHVNDYGAGEKTCRYNKGALVGGPSSCPKFEVANKREKSLPPGCVKTLTSSTQQLQEPCLQQYQ